MRPRLVSSRGMRFPTSERRNRIDRYVRVFQNVLVVWFIATFVGVMMKKSL